MATRNKELKPPPELVEAIQSTGNMTAPGADSTASFSEDTPRQVRNRLLHEEPQSKEVVQQRRGITEGGEGAEQQEEGDDERPSAMEKRWRHEEMAAMQSKGAPYQRNHPGAGKAGQGDQNVDSAFGIARDSRKGPRDYR